jgi:ABC-type sulfate transport system permease component
MGRLFLILMVLAACVVIAMILHSIITGIIEAGQRGLRPVLGQTKDGEMAPTGIQKAAYVALIVVLFGVASGWLGGM